ncbi:Na/Pi symporter [Nitrospirota bacterium]
MEKHDNQSKMDIILKLLLTVVFLYLFLISISLMGASFKGFGKAFAETLLNSTTNSFVGLFIGILATSLIQSSSTTTSIVVGMVASGVLSIGNAVPIIMGANIGTTATNTLVALGHVTRREEFRRAIAGATMHDFFNLIVVSILFPIELATGMLQKSATYLATVFIDTGGATFVSPIKLAVSPVVKLIKHFFIDTVGMPGNSGYILMLVLSMVIIFISLYSIVKIMRSVIIEKVERGLEEVLGANGFIGIIAGLIITIAVQSSSITTSLLVPLIGAGVLSLEVAFPITMGANIGTTTTAILASFATGNPAAITIAFVHLLFNLFGVLFLYPIRIFREIPIWLARWLGDLAFKKRRYAFMYVIGVFFIMPGILIGISRL